MEKKLMEAMKLFRVLTNNRDRLLAEMIQPGYHIMELVERSHYRRKELGTYGLYPIHSILFTGKQGWGQDIVLSRFAEVTHLPVIVANLAVKPTEELIEKYRLQSRVPGIEGVPTKKVHPSFNIVIDLDQNAYTADWLDLIASGKLNKYVVIGLSTTGEGYADYFPLRVPFHPPNEAQIFSYLSSKTSGLRRTFQKDEFRPLIQRMVRPTTYSELQGIVYLAAVRMIIDDRKLWDMSDFIYAMTAVQLIDSNHSRGGKMSIVPRELFGAAVAVVDEAIDMGDYYHIPSDSFEELERLLDEAE